MRIGLFSDYYQGMNDGTAIATEISRQGLSTQGHKVYVICPAIRRPFRKTGVVGLPSLPGLVYPGIRLVWPFNKRALAKVEKLNLDVIHIETPILTGLFGLWAARKLKIPVVMSAHLDMEFMSQYSVAPPALFILGFFVAVICRQPKAYLRVIFARRQRETIGRRTDFAWRTFSFLSDRCDQTVAISRKIYDQLLPYSRRKNLVIVPNGVDLDIAKLPSKNATRLELGLNPDDFILLTASRLVREKRIDFAISAMLRLAKKQPSTKLVMLNDGPERKKLERLVNDLGLQGQVIFKGLIRREEIYKYMVAADVFINPCLREVASLAILEAGLCAKPLLLFDKRLSEPLADGENGFFVSSSRQLADKVEWFIKHPARLQTMGSASRRRIKATYSVAVHTHGLAKVYKRVTARD